MFLSDSGDGLTWLKQCCVEVENSGGQVVFLQLPNILEGGFAFFLEELKKRFYVFLESQIHFINLDFIWLNIPLSFMFVSVLTDKYSVYSSYVTLNQLPHTLTNFNGYPLCSPSDCNPDLCLLFRNYIHAIRYFFLGTTISN